MSLNESRASFPANTLAAPCAPWGDTRHPLVQGAYLCLAAALLLPAVRRSLLQLLVRLLFGLGFLLFSIWTGLTPCTGPDVLVWALLLMVVNGAQVSRLAHRLVPPHVSPLLLELYSRVFAPLKVSRAHFRTLVRIAHVEPLDVGESYASEGITQTDQRLAILLSGRMKVTCEDIILHYLLPSEFVDSPEWESCASNIDKRFQVSLVATEPCQLLCWGRKELLTILEANPFLNVLMDNLIGKDIAYKLYSLNGQHRHKDSLQDKVSVAESLEFWRNPQVHRSRSLDMLHTSKKGTMRSLAWKRPEKPNRRTSSVAASQMGDSSASNIAESENRKNRFTTPV